MPVESLKTLKIEYFFPHTAPSHQAPRALYLTWLQSSKIKNSIWRPSDVDPVLYSRLHFAFRTFVSILFRFLFISLPLSLINRMEKQITASPVQATAKAILQQKVRLKFKTLTKILMAMLKPNC